MGSHIIVAVFPKATECFVRQGLFFKTGRAECVLQMEIQHEVFRNLIIRIVKEFFDDQCPYDPLIGAFGREALSLYRTEKRFSSMEGNISSANTFAHDRSRAFCSLAVSPAKLSMIDIRMLLFAAKHSIFKVLFADTF